MRWLLAQCFRNQLTQSREWTIDRIDPKHMFCLLPWPPMWYSLLPWPPTEYRDLRLWLFPLKTITATKLRQRQSCLSENVTNCDFWQKLHHKLHLRPCTSIRICFSNPVSFSLKIIHLSRVCDSSNLLFTCMISRGKIDKLHLHIQLSFHCAFWKRTNNNNNNNNGDDIAPNLEYL